MYSKHQQELLRKFAKLSDYLFELGIITTDSFTGEIGEFVACKIFNLDKTERVTRAVDGISKKGERYQVKAKIITKGYRYNIKKLETDLFDYLIVVFFDRLYDVKKVLRIPTKKIKQNEVNILSSNLHTFEEIDPSNFKISTSVRNAIKEFAIIYNELEKQGIIRSRRIVGDIGEFYASQRLDLKLTENKNEKGIDARHANGLTFEIKTRRVYSSGRRNSETRRINNLAGKSADYLIVVTLDKSFRCAGMWIMPIKNILNPKSANLKIVNATQGTLNLIPSRISWLDTGEQFKNFAQLAKNSLKKPAKKGLSEAKDKLQQKSEIEQIIEIQEEFEKQSKEVNKGCLTFILIVAGVLLLLALLGSIL